MAAAVAAAGAGETGHTAVAAATVGLAAAVMVAVAAVVVVVMVVAESNGAWCGGGLSAYSALFPAVLPFPFLLSSSACHQILFICLVLFATTKKSLVLFYLFSD